MIDSHCHLADKAFSDDLDEVLLRADEHGVEAMICISDSMEDAKKGVEMSEKYEQIFCTIGVHPHNAKDWKSSDVDALKALAARSENVKAIGEIGLDYHYDFSPRGLQKNALAAQLKIAEELNLPVVLHNRESLDDMYDIVWQSGISKAVMHCCTEKWDDVKKWVDRGYFLSFTGIATYPKSDDIRQTISMCPIEQMMIETDAPYLAPVPHRGKRNEPAYVTEVLRLVSELKGISLREADIALSRNTVNFFSL